MIFALFAALVSVADVHRIADITDPVFAPDGQTIAYTVSTHDVAADKTVSDIWSVAHGGGEPRRLTRMPRSSEWLPRIAAGRLVFLSDAAKDETTQVWTMSARGGHARQVTSISGGVSDYVLSPDGNKAVVVAEIGSLVATEGTPPPIVIDRFLTKEDGRGWLDDRRQQLLLVDMKTGKTEPLATGTNDHWLPSWSPDGKWIAFVSLDVARGERTLDYNIYITSPVSGATPRKISNFKGADLDPYWESRPEWSPDSRRLVWLQSAEDKWIYYAPQQLVVADIDTGKNAALARIDRNFYKPRWSSDGTSILALVEQDRDTWLARVEPASGKIDYLTSGARFAYDFAESGGRIAVLDGDTRAPYVLRDPVGGITLADHNAWLAGKSLADVRNVAWKSGDGTEIHGLLTLPPGEKPGKPLPLIVRVHGGPVYQFSHEFMFDWQLYAAHGYAVLAVNPRGSSGRGFDFARAIYADWGNVDVADVKAGIDWAIRSGIANPKRIGIGGWSYGGILTNYMIASDTRLKAAVSGAGQSNMLAAYGTDQYAREYELELGTPWEDFESYARVSYPFLEAGRIETPTLFLCAEADENVPCLGAEQMYQALRSRRIPTRLVIYPGEDHGLTVPSYIADRLTRSLGWYDRFLAPDK